MNTLGKSNVTRESALDVAYASSYNIEKMLILFEKYDRSQTKSTEKDEAQKSVMKEPSDKPQVIYPRDPKEIKALELKTNMKMSEWKLFRSCYDRTNDGRPMQYFLSDLEPVIETSLRRHREENPEYSLDFDMVRKMSPQEFEDTIVIPFLMDGEETLYEATLEAIKILPKLSADSTPVDWSNCIFKITEMMSIYKIKDFTRTKEIISGAS